jgi:para-nitrobenzyl esterase
MVPGFYLCNFKEIKRMIRKLINYLVILLLAVSFGAAAPSSSAVWAAAAAPTASLRYQQGLVQTTQFGQVQGYRQDNALVWEGIPYGKPPVGELRWRAPQDPAPWPGIKETVKESVAFQLTAAGVIGGDDSLNLTIYRPDTAADNLPVLFYIHGGNNQTGASTDMEAAEFVVKTDSLVVSVNHRLDVLGFFNLPALRTGDPLEDSGNYALLDFSKALDWTAANISAFGGDPGNITIAGFSAGGRDVLAILTSPIFAGKFRQAISFSGGPTIVDPEAARKIFAQKLAQLVLDDKIKPNLEEAAEWLLQNTKEVRDYLYSLPSARLVAAVGNGNLRMASFPHLFADGAVLPREAFDSKRFNSVPLILLNSASEFSMFAVNSPYFANAKAAGTLRSNPQTRKELDFAVKYGSLLYEHANAEDAVRRAGKAYKAPIYVASVLWGADPKLVGEEMALLWGAHHGIFLPLITEKPRLAAKSFPQVFASAAAADLGDKLRQYLKNFLWRGDPNGGGLPLWRPWGAKPNQLLLDADRERAIISTSSRTTSFKEIINQIKNDNSISAAAKQKIIAEVLNGRWFSQELDQTFKTPGVWLQK